MATTKINVRSGHTSLQELSAHVLVQIRDELRPALAALQGNG